MIRVKAKTLSFLNYLELFSNIRFLIYKFGLLLFRITVEDIERGWWIVRLLNSVAPKSMPEFNQSRSSLFDGNADCT